jgi:CO/xanthine dehydrogenase FAD-binding subunit
VTASLHIASTVDDATRQLADGARIVAGGTDLVVGARQGKAPLPERLVAIHRLGELRCVEHTNGALRLGALVNHAQLATHPIVRQRLTALADAAAIVGSHATRAQGTIGGNLMNASPAMETGGPLICFGAGITLRSATDTRSLELNELWAGPGRTNAMPTELLDHVMVPLPLDGTGSCYVRLEYRRQMEIAVVGATALLRIEDERVVDARVAVTALAPTIRRIPEAEAELLDSDAGPEAARRAAEKAAAGCTPISDVRASADYRTAMAAVITRRAIEGAAARARGREVPIPASPALHGGFR